MSNGIYSDDELGSAQPAPSADQRGEAKWPRWESGDSLYDYEQKWINHANALEVQVASLKAQTDILWNELSAAATEVVWLRAELEEALKYKALAVELQLRIRHTSGADGLLDEVEWFENRYDALSRGTEERGQR